MEDDRNPYAAPGEAPSVPPLGGRGAIAVLCVCAGLLAVMSFVAFAYQSLYKTPEGDWFVRTNPFWVFNHLVRATGLSILTWQMGQYFLALGRLRTAADFEAFTVRHNHLWNWTAVVLTFVIAYSIWTVSIGIR